jgi:hypothetical protein
VTVADTTAGQCVCPHSLRVHRNGYGRCTAVGCGCLVGPAPQLRPAARRTPGKPSERSRLEAESEKQFQAAVVDLARRLGWRVFHPWLSLHSASGWPDLFMVRPPRAIAAELKAERGVVSAAQRGWLADLARAGVETHIWWPSQKQEIAEVLSRNDVQPCPPR